jgi:hypothetical protein
MAGLLSPWASRQPQLSTRNNAPAEEPAGEPSPMVEAPPSEEPLPTDEAPTEEPPVAEEPSAESTAEA